MPTLMPEDDDAHSLPVLRLRPGGAQSVASGSSSARNATAFATDTRVVSVYATADVYIEFGDETVVASASSHFYPTGEYYDFAIGGGKTPQFTHIAVLQVSAAGTAYLSEKE